MNTTEALEGILDIMKLTRERQARYVVALAVATVLTLVISGGAFAAPKMTVIKDKVDFGSIGQGKSVNLEFPFKNSGDSQLTIGTIHTSCGCTNATATLKTLKPGQQASIKAVFNSGSFRGKVTKTITVQTNDPAKPSVQLSVSGVVQPSVESLPAKISFGVLPKSKDFHQTLIIKPLDPSGFQIKSVNTRSKYIQLGTPRKASKVKGAYELPVTIKGSSAPTGNIFETIQISTNLKVQPTLVVVVQGKVASG